MRNLLTLLLLFASPLTFAQEEGSFSLLYFMNGDYEKAIATAQEALPSIEKEYGKICEGYMHTLVALGESYRKTGRIAAMEKLYADYYEVLKHAPTDQDLIFNLELKYQMDQMTVGLSQNPEQYKELTQSVEKIMPIINIAENLEENEDFEKSMEKMFSGEDITEGVESFMNDVFGQVMGETGEDEKNDDNPTQSEEVLENINEASIDAPAAGNEYSSATEATSITLEEIDKAVKNIAALNEDERKTLEHQMLTFYEQARTSPSKIDYDRMVCYHLARFYEATNQIEKAKSYLATFNQEVYQFHKYMYQDVFAMAKPEDGYTDHRIDLSLFSRLFLQTTSHTNNFVLSHYGEHPSVTELMYNTFLIEKGMMLETARTMRQDILTSNDPYSLRVFDFWTRTKDELVALGNPPADTALADSLAYVSRVLRRELLRQAKEGLQTDLEKVQQALQSGEAAIEFVQFPYFPQGEHPNLNMLEDETELDESQVNATLSKVLAVPDTSLLYMALVLRPQDEYPQLIPLCNQAQLNDLFQRDSTSMVASDLARQLYVRGVGLANPVSYKGDELYELVWEPLEGLLANTNTIYFSPAGKLHQVAFAALPQQEGILLDRYQLQQVSSTRVLAYRDTQPEIRPASAALFGGIPYNADLKELQAIARQAGFQTKGSVQAPYYLQAIDTFDILEGAETEVTTISSQLEKQQIAVELYTGNQTLEERFKEQGIRETPSPSILHVATHGFFVDEAATRGGEESMESAEDALTRSGLAFAGANRFWRGESMPGLEDGILLASEVTQMNLQNTDLVVLSACETGLGQVQGSEGVYGLQRAIREAGAKYLIMSLWEVPDEETVDLMTLFYDNWLAKKQHIREAFTNAQKTMSAENDPDSWAAFVLVE